MNLSDLLLTTGSQETTGLPDIVSAIREHLRMDVAFVSEFQGGRRTFRVVDEKHPGGPVKEGASDPLDHSYCQRVVDGRLPELMQDARDNPEAARLPATFALPVGAHLSVPLRLSDGSLYGTLCAFSYSPDRTLNERDLQMLRVFADLSSRLIERERDKSQATREAQRRIASVLEGDELSVVFQPIWELGEERMIGLEALSRFSALPQRSPDVWFNEANVVGMGGELEKHAANAALSCLPHIPPHMYVSVNMSPEHVLDGTLAAVLNDLPLSRVLLELTEHTAITAYQELTQKLQPLRERGLRLAIDDAGAGYASFRHILNLSPDRIKLDMSITKNIDRDPSRRALAAAFTRFAEEIGSKLIAEGVETAEELQTLQELGIRGAQGNFLCAAMPLAGVLDRVGGRHRT